MADTFYFSHDYNARSDEKIKSLIRKHGMLGVGIFWSIIEDLYQNANAMRTDYECIAYDLRTDVEVVKSVINDFDLFVFEADSFGSLSIQNRLIKRDEKSRKASESAHKRWNNANAMQTHTERNAENENRNAIKESKVKDIKVKESKGKEKKDTNTVVANATDTRWKFWVESWFLFYENKLGVKPSLSVAEAKALKTIRKYLSQMPGDNEPDENGLQAWQQILDTWQCQDAWMITQLDLKVISSKINVILANIKKHTDAKLFRPAEINDRSNRAAEFDKLFAARYPSGGSTVGKDDAKQVH